MKPAEHWILDMLDYGLPLGIDTLRWSVLDEDRNSVPSILERMVKEGRIIEVKKNRFMRRDSE